MSSFIQHTNRATLGIALIAAVIIGNSTITDSRVITEKAAAQKQALSQINRWKAEYDALKPYQAQWNKALLPTAEIKDLYRVYAALDIERHGLKADQGNLLVDKIEPITLNETLIHAYRVCVRTATDVGLTVTAPRFSPDLLDGLKQLAARHDIEIGNIQLSAHNGAPKATMDLCLIFRS